MLFEQKRQKAADSQGNPLLSLGKADFPVIKAVLFNQYVFQAHEINSIPVCIFNGGTNLNKLQGKAYWQWGRPQATAANQVSSENASSQALPCCDAATYQARPVFSPQPTTRVGLVGGTLQYVSAIGVGLSYSRCGSFAQCAFGFPYAGYAFDGLPRDNNEFGPYEVQYFVRDDYYDGREMTRGLQAYARKVMHEATHIKVH